MKDALKKYFDDLIKNDTALKAVYTEGKLDECVSYIISQARKKLNNKNGYVEDSIVFKWARDFYLGDTAEKNPKEEIVAVIHEEKAKPKKQICQLSLFDIGD